MVLHAQTLETHRTLIPQEGSGYVCPPPIVNDELVIIGRERSLFSEKNSRWGRANFLMLRR
jgi:hypothetical protein